jgi:hypothetical protein
MEAAGTADLYGIDNEDQVQLHRAAGALVVPA